MRLALTLTVTVLACGCTDKDTEQATRTRRERDSVIGESRLPGAQGVRGALEAADSAAARQRRAEGIN